MTLLEIIVALAKEQDEIKKTELIDEAKNLIDNTENTENEDYKIKYEELAEKYTQRFYDEVFETKKEEIKAKEETKQAEHEGEEETEKLKKDAEKLTLDDIFEKEEE